MGQKVNPIGLRLGINRTWDSRWFSRKEYGAQLLDDLSLRKFLGARLTQAAISKVLIERMAKMNPLERLGTPEDIAAAVAFLVGPDGGWINGQVLRANGGMV